MGDGAVENDFTLQDEAEVTPEWACSRSATVAAVEAFNAVAAWR